MTQLSITGHSLEEALRQARSDRRGVLLPLGHHAGDGQAYIGHPSGAAPWKGGYALCHYLPAQGPEFLDEVAGTMAATSEQAAPSALLLVSGAGEQARMRAWLRSVDGFAPVDEVLIVAPAMPVIRAIDTAPARPVPLRWSRLAGALGEPTWRRLQELRIAVVGCGRSGSLVAMALSRMGVAQLDLIDPDRVELHNLDAMASADTLSVGHPKAEVLAAAARAVWPNGDVRAHVRSASALATLETLIGSDLLVTTVDHDGARWSANAVAALYLKPLLDIGTGVFARGAGRDAGGDVRLLLPGEACLSCFGGLGDAAQIAASREGPLAEGRQALERQWRGERAGSLRSLNQTATGMGLRLLETFVAGDLDRSTWLQLSFAADGIPQIATTTAASHRGPARGGRCTFCRVAGAADAGLAQLRELDHSGALPSGSQRRN